VQTFDENLSHFRTGEFVRQRFTGAQPAANFRAAEDQMIGFVVRAGLGRDDGLALQKVCSNINGVIPNSA
jgi:hypothetical protein